MNPKDLLKSFLTAEMTKEQVQKVVEIDKAIDGVVKENEDLKAKVRDLQQDYINAVKNTAFSKQSEDADIDEQVKPLSLEECLEKVINERKKGIKNG